MSINISGVIPSGPVLEEKREPAVSGVEGDLPRIHTRVRNR